MPQREADKDTNPYKSPESEGNIGDLVAPRLSGFRGPFAYPNVGEDKWARDCRATDYFDKLEEPVPVKVAAQSHIGPAHEHLEDMQFIGIDRNGMCLVHREGDENHGFCVSGYSLEITNPELVLPEECRKRDLKCSAFMHSFLGAIGATVGSAIQAGYKLYQFSNQDIDAEDSSPFTLNTVLWSAGAFVITTLITSGFHYYRRSSSKKAIREEYEEYREKDSSNSALDKSKISNVEKR